MNMIGRKKSSNVSYTEGLLIISNLRQVQIYWPWNKNGLADPCTGLSSVYDTRA